MSNASIYGVGKVSGGEYTEVKIRGVGEVTGDILCEIFSVSGNAKSKFNITTKMFKVNGFFKTEGKLLSEDLKITGVMNSLGNVTGVNLSCSGKMNCDNMDVIMDNDMKISGVFTAKNVKTNTLLLSSTTTKIENLECKKIDIKINYLSKVGNKIKQTKNKINILTCENCDIDFLECDILNIKDGVIGPNVNIGKIIYSGTIDVHKQAVVGEVIVKENRD